MDLNATAPAKSHWLQRLLKCVVCWQRSDDDDDDEGTANELLVLDAPELIRRYRILQPIAYVSSASASTTPSTPPSSTPPSR